MVNDEILELYNKRREMMIVMLQHVNDGNISTECLELEGLIVDMAELTNDIIDMCNEDRLLLDMYRRLSLALSKEEYEKALVVKEEIINYKS